MDKFYATNGNYKPTKNDKNMKYKPNKEQKIKTLFRAISNSATFTKPLMDTVTVIESIEKTMKPIMAQLTKFNKQMEDIQNFISIAFEPLTQIAQLKPFIDIGSGFSYWLEAISKITGGEFLYWKWDELDKNIIKEIASADDFDVIMEKLIFDDNKISLQVIIDNIKNNKFFINYINNFEECIFALNNGKYNLSIIGLFTIIDGILADISKNYKTNFLLRIENIITEITKDENDKGKATYLFVEVLLNKRFTDKKGKIRLTNIFFADSDFSKDEPKELNRNWVLYGRSKRICSRLDCAKLLFFINGLLNI